MARMYSRRKGKAGSKKPVAKRTPAWLTYSPKEVEQIVIKVAKTEKSPARVGTILRDTYGLPSVKTITQRSITQLLSENKINPRLPEDIASLLKRIIALQKHMEQHKKDQTCRRGLNLTESKLKRLAEYYKRRKLLPKDWAYRREKAKLLLE